MEVGTHIVRVFNTHSLFPELVQNILVKLLDTDNRRVQTDNRRVHTLGSFEQFCAQFTMVVMAHIVVAQTHTGEHSFGAYIHAKL